MSFHVPTLASLHPAAIVTACAKAGFDATFWVANEIAAAGETLGDHLPESVSEPAYVVAEAFGDAADSAASASAAA